MMNACMRRSLLAVPVLTAFGCSDPVPLPSQGSATLNIDSVAVNQMSCPFTAKQYQIGSPAPTKQEPGISVVDGDKGSIVSCSVQGSGPFTFSGSLAATTSDGRITLQFSNGKVDAGKSTGTVDVSVYTTDLLAPFSNGSTPCTVTVNYAQLTPGHPGSIWAQFECPTIANPPSSLCGISTSTLLLRNCNG